MSTLRPWRHMSCWQESTERGEHDGIPDGQDTILDAIRYTQEEASVCLNSDTRGIILNGRTCLRFLLDQEKLDGLQDYIRAMRTTRVHDRGYGYLTEVNTVRMSFSEHRDVSVF